MRLERPFNASRHRRKRRLMENAIHAGNSARDNFGVRQIALDKLNSTAVVTQIFLAAGTQVIDHTNAVAPRD